jgi:hypothetical protein
VFGKFAFKDDPRFCDENFVKRYVSSFSEPSITVTVAHLEENTSAVKKKQIRINN